MVQALCDCDAREGRKNHRTMTSSKRRRHTPDQIIRKLAEGHKQLAAGKELDEVCRHLEIAEGSAPRSGGVSRVILGVQSPGSSSATGSVSRVG